MRVFCLRLERVDQLVRALVSLAALAEAAVDHLLQMIAAGEAPDLVLEDPLPRVPLHQHPDELPHLVHVVARLPLGRGAREDVTRRREHV